MSDKKSDALKKELLELEAFLSSIVFAKWCDAREVEIQFLEKQAALSATSWEEVNVLRGKRQNTIEMQNTFGELQDSLKQALSEALESEQQSPVK